MMKRRQFLKISAMTALAPSLNLFSCDCGHALPIIDTHQHLWDLDMFPLRWVTPPLDRDFLMEDYLEEVKGQGVVKTIYMEVNVPPEYRKKEARWALELCEDPANPMAGAVIRADPKSPEFESEIRSLADNPFLKGIRYSIRDDEEIRSPSLIIAWITLARTG
jgi:L-fuconolactonase